MRFLVWLAVNALALGVAVWLLDGITLTGSSDTDKFIELVIVGAIFGVINIVRATDREPALAAADHPDARA